MSVIAQTLLTRLIWLTIGLFLLTGCGQDDRTPLIQVPDSTSSQPVLHHQIRVIPDLETGILSVEDHIRFSGQHPDKVEFTLGSPFSLKRGTIDWPADSTAHGLHYYKTDTAQSLQLDYSGKLASTPDCAWLTEACVLLDENGLFLDANSHWYPEVAGAMHTFELQVVHPEGWVSLSQGEQTTTGWQEFSPQNAMYLLAGAFKVYRSVGKHGTAMVYLRSEDAALAQTYLQATHRYLDEYSNLLGAYPYAKFATVESFWETGWGMPSFTLLGSRVMRLPFILDSSFPHEILHNWWGNGVYVNAEQGNWSEGLTAYLADYRHRESKGEGMNYRRDTLQKYAAFTTAGGDFPLQDFRSRHDQTTQAVGYGKSLMLFHMLREQLGGDLFITGLRQFYQDFAFRTASFEDLRHSFEQVSGENLQDFFQQWLTRSGAPTLSITRHQLGKDTQDTAPEGAYTFTLGLRQTSVPPIPSTTRSADAAVAPFHLQIPVAATFADGSKAIQTVALQQTEQTFELHYARAPLEIAVDPGFDVFRLPAQAEVPPALNVLFSREPKTFVLARQVPAGMEIPWAELVDTLSYGQNNMKVQYDDAPLPDSGIVVLLGGDNAALTDLLERAQQPFKLSETAYTLNSVNYTCGLHSLALTLQAGQQALILLDATTPEALTTLASKIPHYGKYSYVLFNAATGENVAKGQWEVTDSPLSIKLTTKP